MCNPSKIKRLFACGAALQLIAGDAQSVVKEKVLREAMEAGLRPNIAESFADEVMQAALEKKAEFQSHARKFLSDLYEYDLDEEEAG